MTTLPVNSHLYKTATVFGGTGFVGRQVVRELTRAGYQVKIATRFPAAAYRVRVNGPVGQVVPVAVDYNSYDSIAAALRGSQVVVNCIGMLVKKRRSDFQRAHVSVPEKIAQACAAEGVERFVHFSALGVDRSRARYAQTKLAGERVVHEKFPAAIILRPSIIFGVEDKFFNMFAELGRYLPVLPLIGGGKTKFQPVYVGDVADAVMAAISALPVGDLDPRGRIYELGGPEIVDFRSVHERIFNLTRRPRRLVRLPWAVAKLQGAILGLLPGKLLTVDQVEMLRTDNVVSGQLPGLAELGVAATGMNFILPGYLARYAPGGRLGDKQRA